MGRGLSGLQGAILLRALDNREREADLPPGEFGRWPDIYGCEVAADHFGWPLPDDYRWYHHCRRPHGTPPALGNRVHAAISRAFARLERRGLGEGVSGAYTRWSGFILNDRGIEIARQLRLSVNLYSRCDQINR
jgi:hypothetical protein